MTNQTSRYTIGRDGVFATLYDRQERRLVVENATEEHCHTVRARLTSAPAPMPADRADWVRLNVLPLMWRHPDGIEELRTCVCQAPPSDWLGGIEEPAARLWNSDGLPIAWARDRSHGRYVAGLVALWETGRTCRRRQPLAAATHPTP